RIAGRQLGRVSDHGGANIQPFTLRNCATASGTDQYEHFDGSSRNRSADWAVDRGQVGWPEPGAAKAWNRVRICDGIAGLRAAEHSTEHRRGVLADHAGAWRDFECVGIFEYFAPIEHQRQVPWTCFRGGAWADHAGTNNGQLCIWNRS